MKILLYLFLLAQIGIAQTKPNLPADKPCPADYHYAHIDGVTMCVPRIGPPKTAPKPIPRPQANGDLIVPDAYLAQVSDEVQRCECERIGGDYSAYGCDAMGSPEHQEKMREKNPQCSFGISISAAQNKPCAKSDITCAAHPIVAPDPPKPDYRIPPKPDAKQVTPLVLDCTKNPQCPIGKMCSCIPGTYHPLPSFYVDDRYTLYEFTIKLENHAGWKCEPTNTDEKRVTVTCVKATKAIAVPDHPLSAPDPPKPTTPVVIHPTMSKAADTEESSDVDAFINSLIFTCPKGMNVTDAKHLFHPNMSYKDTINALGQLECKPTPAQAGTKPEAIR